MDLTDLGIDLVEADDIRVLDALKRLHLPQDVVRQPQL